MPKAFTTISADPGWKYKDNLRMSKLKRSSMDSYRTMTVEKICNLAIMKGPRNWRIAHHKIATPALLFLCVTNPMLLDGTGPRVCRAWGFEPKQLITWVKGRIDKHGRLVLQVGLGHYTRGCTEHIILATRGRCKSLIKRHDIPNVILAPLQRAPNGRKHSAKPEAMFEMIEALAPGRYLELFSRKTRRGWTVWGNQVRKDGRK